MSREKHMGTGECLGRGQRAVRDMKARIALLRSDGVDVVDALWRRHVHAITGDGHVYDLDPEEADEPRRV